MSASLGGYAAAQAMFSATAQAAGNVGGADGAPAGVAEASLAGTGIDVAVLRMALDTERYMVNILA